MDRPARIEELATLLRQVNHRLYSQAQEAMRNLNLTPPHMMVMRVLHRQPGQGVSELARRLGMAKSHVSDLVADLTERGWVEKQDDPSDRRLTRLVPTAAAARAAERARTLHLQALENLLTPLSDDELERVLAGVRTLAAALTTGTEEETC